MDQTYKSMKPVTCGPFLGVAPEGALFALNEIPSINITAFYFLNFVQPLFSGSPKRHQNHCMHVFLNEQWMDIAQTPQSQDRTNPQSQGDFLCPSAINASTSKMIQMQLKCTIKINFQPLFSLLSAIHILCLMMLFLHRRILGVWTAGAFLDTIYTQV